MNSHLTPSIEFPIYIDTRIYQIYLFILFLAVCIQKTWDDIPYDGEISDVESTHARLSYRMMQSCQRKGRFGGCGTGSTKMASRDIYKQMHRL